MSSRGPGLPLGSHPAIWIQISCGFVISLRESLQSCWPCIDTNPREKPWSVWSQLGCGFSKQETGPWFPMDCGLCSQETGPSFPISQSVPALAGLHTVSFVHSPQKSECGWKKRGRRQKEYLEKSSGDPRALGLADLCWVHVS